MHGDELREELAAVKQDRLKPGEREACEALVADVDGETVAERVNSIMASAANAAHNTEVTTSNAMAMSSLAREAATKAHPHVLDAVNQTSEMLDSLYSFSAHPQLVIGGSSGLGRRH